jgi:hypothetical protein
LEEVFWAVDASRKRFVMPSYDPYYLILTFVTVQQILFLIKPECLVSMLICPKMDENEAIIISGAERFTNFTGT